MSNKFKDINTKNHIYYFFDDVINIKIFDSNNINIHENSLHWICDDQRFEIRKNLQCKSFIPYFSRVNRYFEEVNRNKYLALVPTNESLEKIKKYGELWSKIRDLMRLTTKNSDDYD